MRSVRAVLEFDFMAWMMKNGNVETTMSIA